MSRAMSAARVESSVRRTLRSASNLARPCSTSSPPRPALRRDLRPAWPPARSFFRSSAAARRIASSSAS
jgi:hypothetical protein